MTRLVLAVDVADRDLRAATRRLADYLERSGLEVRLVDGVGPLTGPGAEAVLVFADGPCDEATEDSLLMAVRAGVAVLLAGPTLAAWRGAQRLLDAAGVIPGALSIEHEMRVRLGAKAGQLGDRLDGDLLVTGRLLLLDKVADSADVLLSADWRLTEQPVMTVRDVDGPMGTCTLGQSATTLDDPAVSRLILRWVRRAAGLADGPAVRVGLLGYGTIGHEHNAAIAATPGLELAAVCDRNPDRIAAAQAYGGHVRGLTDPEQLLVADDVDLVIVSTPPDSHTDWVLRALDAGKHVVVEKPFALTVAEADLMIAGAAAGDRLLACYQNRRWDADYLALKRVVRSGAIGDVFHYESFIGGYGHPCNYWHSDEAVSGGAIYDWGSHYLDWLLDLLPQPVDYVTAATHKLVWHDVSNADSSRVTVRFVDGVEAEFVHSDIAAALKPKWYVLGTRGALVGRWRYESVLARNAVGNLDEDPLAASESPAELSVCTLDGVGGIAETALPVGRAPQQPFHRELADALLCGAPMSLTPEGSRRNIAVMEAATISAREGGRPVPLPGA